MLQSEVSQNSLPWLRIVRSGIVIDDTGLSFSNGPRLARMAHDGSLALRDDRERISALLSIAYRHPVSKTTLHHIEAAADDWRRGDRALANLRLVVSGLPSLDQPGDAARLSATEGLLDAGVTPHDLMKALDFDASVLDLDKYDPDQPRVPAGSGRESGRWSDGVASDDNTSFSSGARPKPSAPVDIPAPRLPIVQVAANGPIEPGGLALQLRCVCISESMSVHDSGDRGWLELRSKKRWSFGLRRCGR